MRLKVNRRRKRNGIKYYLFATRNSTPRFFPSFDIAIIIERVCRMDDVDSSRCSPLDRHSPRISRPG